MLGTLWDGPLRDGRVHPLTLPAPPCSPAHPPSTPVRAGRGTVSTERGTELESGETLRNKLDHVGPHQAAMSGGRLSPRRICLLCDQLTGPTRRRHTEPQSPPMYTPPPPPGQRAELRLHLVVRAAGAGREPRPDHRGGVGGRAAGAAARRPLLGLEARSLWVLCTATSTSFSTISRTFLSSTPPHTCRVLCPTWCLC